MTLDQLILKLNGLPEYIITQANNYLLKEGEVERLERERLAKGLDTDENLFGSYRPATVARKRAKGTYKGAKVTWNDYGNFVSGIEVKPIDLNSVDVTSSDIKWQFGIIQNQKYLETDKILGLSQKDANKLAEDICNDIANNIHTYFV